MSGWGEREAAISTTSIEFLPHNGRRLRFVDLPASAGADLVRLPWLMRLLFENVLRNGKGSDGEAAKAAILGWLASGTSNAEIEFVPGRVLMHDTTCVPALVDVAAMRSALAEAGGDPTLLNPVLAVDVSVDHSVAVDHYGSPDALQRNMERELGRNLERYRFMKWATRALKDLRVHPPGTGIMHTLNLERSPSRPLRGLEAAADRVLGPVDRLACDVGTLVRGALAELGDVVGGLLGLVVPGDLRHDGFPLWVLVEAGGRGRAAP